MPAFPLKKMLPAVLILLFATVALYFPVTSFEFIRFDDDVYVVDNPLVKDGPSMEGLRWALTGTYAANWHPLTWISHMIDCGIFGTEHPGGHHFTNLLLHTANTVLLFIVLHAMTGAVWRSFFVAALFALHPLHIESAAWVAERKDVLSAFFWMLALWLYYFYVRKPSAWRLLPVCLAFALGLAAKPMVVTLPFVLLLLDYWPLKRFAGLEEEAPSQVLKRLVSLVVEKWPLFVLSTASCVVTIYAQGKNGAIASLDYVPFVDRVQNAVVAYVDYLLKTVWPHSLAVFYPHPVNRPFWQVGLSLAVLSAVTVLAVRQWKKRPYCIVGWLWYLGTLAPVIGLLQVGEQSMADRYSYLPLIGPFIALTFWFDPKRFASTQRIQRAVTVCIVSAILTALFVCSAIQLKHWKDSYALFGHALKVTEDNFKMHNNFAVVLMDEKDDPEGALEHFREAVRLKPNYAKAHNGLGALLIRRKELGRAEEHIGKALDLDPGLADAHFNMGLLLSRKGATRKAEASYREAVRLQPHHDKALNNLGILLMNQSKFDEAAELFEAALKFNPNYAEAHTNLGSILSSKGLLDEAAFHFKAALGSDPEFPEALNNLGNVLMKQGDVQEAEKLYRAALSHQPDFPDARYNLANALFQRGKVNDAADELKKLVETDPEYPGVYGVLGNILANRGKYEEAVVQYEEAVARNPNDPEAFNNMGNALIALNRLDDAVACLKKALSLKPDHAIAHHNLGLALFKKGFLKEAAAQYGLSLKYAPDFVDAYHNLGVVLFHLGRTEEAVRSYRKALELNPSHFNAHYNLGYALLKAGRPEDAVKHFYEALRLNPKFPQAYYQLTLAYTALNDGPAAESAFRSLRSISPELARKLERYLSNKLRR